MTWTKNIIAVDETERQVNIAYSIAEFLSTNTVDNNTLIDVAIKPVDTESIIRYMNSYRIEPNTFRIRSELYTGGQAMDILNKYSCTLSIEMRRVEGFPVSVASTYTMDDGSIGVKEREIR